MARELVGLRRMRRWTQREVADRLGISRSYLSMIETERRNPTLLLAGQMADLFGVDVDTLFFAKQCHEE